MDVFIEIQNGSTFSMKLGYWYTVLEIKQKIEKSHRIPVSKQILFFKGKVLQDDLDVEDCVILHNSRIQLVISPDDNPNPNNAQVSQTQTTEESSQPSNSTEDIIAGQDWYLTDEEFRNMQQSWHLPVTTGEPNIQDSPVMVGSNQMQYPQLNSAGQFINVQDSPAMVGSNQVQYPPLNSAGQFINVQDLPGMVGSYTEQSPVPTQSINGQDWTLSAEEIDNIQQFWPLTDNEITPAMVGSNRNDQVVQTEQFPPSDSTGDIIYDQDWPFTPEETMHIQQYWPVTTAEITPVMVRSNQMLQTEQSPLLHSSQQFIDVPETTWSNHKNNHMLQTQQSPLLHSSQQFIDVPETTWSNQKNNHMLQTEQSPLLSSPQQFINVQGIPVTVGSNQKNNHMLQTEQSPLLSSPQQFIDVQDSPETTWNNKKNNHMLQTEQSPLLHSSQQFIDVPETTWSNQKNNHMLQTQQSPLLSSPQQFIEVQDSPVTTWSNQKNNHMLQTEQSPLLSSPQQFINVQGIPVTVGSNEKDQVLLQTEESPPSNSVKEVINISDSPTKVRMSNKKPPRRLRVMVMPYPETRKIPVEVNSGDHVEKLRKELVKIQERCQLNLPQDGYFFIHKQSVMDEDRSFWWNGVDPGDTIEIFPGTVTRGSVERGAY